MTKNDFILQAMISMAGNEKYVTIKECELNDGTVAEIPAIEDEIIYIDAEALANEAEKRMDCPFDNPGEDSKSERNKYLNTIAYNIEEHLDKLDVIADALEQYIRMKD